MLSCFNLVWPFMTLWIVVCQPPPSMRFSRQQYWGGVLCPPPRDLSNPGIEPASLTSPALAGGSFTTSATWYIHINIHTYTHINIHIHNFHHNCHLSLGLWESHTFKLHFIVNTGFLLLFFIWLPSNMHTQSFIFLVPISFSILSMIRILHSNLLSELFLSSDLLLSYTVPRFSVVIQSLSRVWLLETPWSAACQASLSFTVPWILLKLMSTESVMPTNYLILCCPLLLLPSNFPTIKVLPNESTLCIR